MFVCQICNTTQPPGSKPIRTVVEVRDLPGNRWEIAQEKNCCATCAPTVPDVVAAVKARAVEARARAEAARRLATLEKIEGELEQQE